MEIGLGGGSFALEIQAGGGGGSNDSGNPGGRGGLIKKKTTLSVGGVWIFSGIIHC